VDAGAQEPNLAVALGAAWFAAHQQVIDIVGTAGVDPAKIKDAAETWVSHHSECGIW